MEYLIRKPFFQIEVVWRTKVWTTHHYFDIRLWGNNGGYSVYNHEEGINEYRKFIAKKRDQSKTATRNDQSAVEETGRRGKGRDQDRTGKKTGQPTEAPSTEVAVPAEPPSDVPRVQTLT